MVTPASTAASNSPRISASLILAMRMSPSTMLETVMSECGTLMVFMEAPGRWNERTRPCSTPGRPVAHNHVRIRHRARRPAAPGRCGVDGAAYFDSRSVLRFCAIAVESVVRSLVPADAWKKSAGEVAQFCNRLMALVSPLRSNPTVYRMVLLAGALMALHRATA